MHQAGAREFYKGALEYMKANYSEDLKWVESITPSTFDGMTFQGFLWNYCWVVFAANFKVKTLKKHFAAIETAFHDFDPEKVCALDWPKLVFPINNKLKINSFLKGAKQIAREGFECFKSRVKGAGDDGMEVLTCLPYIKGITKKHLARNLGIRSVAKDDIWLVRLVKKFGAANVDQLVGFLSNEFGHSQGVVDLVLWQYCADCGCGEEKPSA